MVKQRGLNRTFCPTTFGLAQKNIFQSADWTWGSLRVLPVMYVSVRGFPPGNAASFHSPETLHGTKKNR